MDAYRSEMLAKIQLPHALHDTVGTFARPRDPRLTDGKLLHYKATIIDGEIIKEHWGTPLPLNSETPFSAKNTQSPSQEHRAGSFELIHLGFGSGQYQDRTSYYAPSLPIERADFFNLYTRSKIDPCLLNFVNTSPNQALYQSSYAMSESLPMFSMKDGNGRIQHMSGQLSSEFLKFGRILWSFEPLTLTSRVIYLNDSDANDSGSNFFEEFSRELEKNISHATCTGPYLLAMILANIVTDITTVNLLRLFHGVIGIEKQTGHTVLTPYDFVDVSRRTHINLSSHLASILINLEIERTKLRKAEETLAQIQKDYSAFPQFDWYNAIPNGPNIEAAPRTRFDKSMAEIISLVPLLQLKVTSLLGHADMLTTRANIQMTVIFNLLTHHDAKTSLEQTNLSIELAKSNQELAEAMQRDSSSMKTVAIMTMIFLPGTFFSALFAMPSIKFPEKPDKVIQDGFGLYWGLTIAATAIVFATWYATTHRAEIREKVRKLKDGRDAKKTA